MAATRPVVGYEYDYVFSIDEELVSRYERKECPEGRKVLMFEMRTSFIMRKIDGQDEIMDTEVFDAQVVDHEDDCATACDINELVVYTRLKEYWMTYEEMAMFEVQALNIAKEAAAADPSRKVIPIVVTMEVRTVQQEGEAIESAMERALRAEKLIPCFLLSNSPAAMALKWSRCDSLFIFFLMELRRKRIDDIDVGLNMMKVCGICLQGPTIGAQVSVLPWCHHAFHSHCIVRRLLELHDRGEKLLCPRCPCLAFHPSMDWSDDE